MSGGRSEDVLTRSEINAMLEVSERQAATAEKVAELLRQIAFSNEKILQKLTNGLKSEIGQLVVPQVCTKVEEHARDLKEIREAVGSIRSGQVEMQWWSRTAGVVTGLVVVVLGMYKLVTGKWP